ncbi:MAG: hypothetical protein K2G97_03670 [Oscillospiraceae bacterium]|nr:hypothetical protein [Oscillospiraceae bacterium]
MKKNILGGFFSSNRFTVCVSVLIAVVAWFVTVMVNDTYSTITINNIPISLDVSNTQAEQLGLDIVKIEPEIVSVNVKGPRYKIGMITKNDITVTPVSLINVTDSGTYDIALVANLKQSQNDVSLGEIAPLSSSFTFDVTSNKTITLTAEAPNVKIESGYVSDAIVCQPERLVVSGPKQSIDNLESIKLITEAFGTLNASKTYDAVLKFISNDGTEMSSSLFKYNSDISFKITIPVYEEKYVPLTFMYKNAPASLDTKLLNSIISPSGINVAGQSENIKNLNEINLGYIDMRELDIGTNFTFQIALASGYKNVDQVTTAVVSFDSSQWSYRSFTVKQIQLSNVPEDYSVNIDTTAIKDVRIVGLSSMINSISEADITATADLTNVGIKEGKQIVPVAIGIVTKNGVWGIGEYSCSVTAKKI